MSKQSSAKAGRVSVSEKQQAEESDLSFDDLDFNMLRIDEELQKELEGQGLVARWINAPRYMNGGNFHKSGWKAYRRPVTESARGGMDFTLGVSPEGYIIRNDLLLAVKRKSDHDRWGARIRHMTKLQNGSESTKASELREKAKSAGVSVQVHEGYDSNGDEE